MGKTPPMRQFVPLAALNLLAPGAGLVALGRPWSGLLVAGVFAASAELGVIGAVVAPAAIGRAVTTAALAAAAVQWGLAQGMLVARIRVLRRKDLPREIEILRRLARRALTRADYAAANAALSIAMSLDDSDPATHIQRARLLAATGETVRAERAWLLAQRLDSEGEYAEEFLRHLEEPASAHESNVEKRA